MGASLLYLPPAPYSPDINPSEHAFAKLKAMLHKAAARTVNAFLHITGRAIETFKPGECAILPSSRL